MTEAAIRLRADHALSVLTPLLSVLSEVRTRIAVRVREVRNSVDDLNTVGRLSLWSAGILGLSNTVSALIGELGVSPFPKRIEEKGSLFGASLALIACGSVAEQVKALQEFLCKEDLLSSDLKVQLNEAIDGLQKLN